MIAYLISLLPNIVIVLFFIIITWIICRLWYATRYIHRNEVRPLQESQHIMQNQYAILAERIKHTELQLSETKAKLEAALIAKDGALQKIVELEIINNQNDIKQGELKNVDSRLIEEIKTAFTDIGGSETEQAKTREQFNFLRQSIKEFKTEFAQKLNATTSHYHELSNQMWQLLELNKKLSLEAEALNKLLQNSSSQEDSSTPPERQFTLTSIKKRS